MPVFLQLTVRFVFLTHDTFCFLRGYTSGDYEVLIFGATRSPTTNQQIQRIKAKQQDDSISWMLKPSQNIPEACCDVLNFRVDGFK